MIDYGNYHLHYSRLGMQPPDYKSCLSNLEKQVIQEAWLPENKQALILDIGCGWGLLLLRLWASGYGNLQGVDISPVQCELAQKGLPPEIKITCGEAINFLHERHKVFEVITIFNLLEHLPVERGLNLLKNCLQALKTDGMIVVRVPNMANLLATSTRYVDLTHVTGYTEWSLCQLLEAAGFRQHQIIHPAGGSFRRWRRNRSWRAPLAGLGLRETLNGLVHRLFYALRGSRLRPTVYGEALTVRSFRQDGP